MVVELRLPSVNRLVCKSQNDAPLVHQSRTHTPCSNVHTHVVAPWFLISARHCDPCTCSDQGQKPHEDQVGLQNQAQNILQVEIKGAQLTNWWPFTYSTQQKR